MFADANVDTPVDSRILRGYSLDDIDHTSLEQYRRLFATTKPDHPWLALSDIELLSKLGGYRKDRVTGVEGFTLAGLLMFGKTESITDIECAPHYFPDYRYYPSKTQDALARWTDRVCPDGTWEANLFQFYRRVLPKLTSFLPRPFVLDEDTRIDETSAHVALREALINLCIHADYSLNASLNVTHSPEQIILSNPGTMLVSRNQYYKGGESVCRNKALQTMFSMLGKAEKAGSGVDKILQGWKDNHWSRPEIDTSIRPDKVDLMLDISDLIKMSDQVTDQASDQVNDTDNQEYNTKTAKFADQARDQAADQVSDQAEKLCDSVADAIVEFCKTPRTIKQIMSHLKMNNRTYMRNTYITPLLGKRLRLTIPDKPTHPRQMYVSI